MTTKERIGFFTNAGRWLDDHWRGALPAVGAAVMTGAMHFLSMKDASNWFWLMFIAGVAATIVGSVLTVRQSTKISQMRRELLDARDPNRVFLLTARTEDWQVELERDLIVQLTHRGYRPTIFVPSRDYSPSEQGLHFHEILDRPSDYVGGIVIPIRPEYRRPEISQFVNDFGRPVVFVDNAPFAEEECPGLTGFVGVSSNDGGKLAASALEAAFRAVDEERTILVVASTSQTSRQRAMAKRLAQSRSRWALEIDEGGDFDRQQAQKIVDLRIRSKKKPKIDAIVCTSDAMTLGCLDALGQLRTTEAPKVVIGYDGIKLTRRIIDDGASPLKRVVVQDTHELAVAATIALSDLIRNRQVSVFQWIKPYLYPTLPSLAGGASKSD